jgi:hypothetical protein
LVVLKIIHKKQQEIKTGGNMKKILSTVGILSLVAGAYLTLSTVNSYTPVADAAGSKSTYSGTIYVAGMGGHYSVADVTIDPNNAAAPINVKSVEMLDIGGKNYPTHDARIDSSDRNTMYWSTYKLDTWKDKEAKGGNLHVGKVDLKSGEVTADMAIAPPERAKWTGANYCASGQLTWQLLLRKEQNGPAPTTAPQASPTLLTSLFPWPTRHIFLFMIKKPCS